MLEKVSCGWLFYCIVYSELVSVSLIRVSGVFSYCCCIGVKEVRSRLIIVVISMVILGRMLLSGIVSDFVLVLLMYC